MASAKQDCAQGGNETEADAEDLAGAVSIEVGTIEDVAIVLVGAAVARKSEEAPN